MAVKQQRLSLVHGQCQAFRESVQEPSFIFNRFSFLFLLCEIYRGYLNNDLALPLPKLLSLSLGPTQSVYLASNEDAHSTLSKGIALATLHISIKWIYTLFNATRRVCCESKDRANASQLLSPEADMKMQTRLSCCQVHFLSSRMWNPYNWKAVQKLCNSEDLPTLGNKIETFNQMKCLTVLFIRCLAPLVIWER